MTTLEDYAAQRFPDHRITVPQQSLSLIDYMTVAQVKGSAASTEVVNRLRREFPTGQVGSVLVMPNDSTLVATEPEDTEGPIDLPWKRPAIVATFFAIAIGAVGLLVGRATTAEWSGAIISAVFLAIVGGVVGALVGGAGRYAGDRAWQQERQGDDVIALVAVCVADEAAAKRAAETLEGLGLIDVRLVGNDGAWHVPST